MRHSPTAYKYVALNHKGFHNYAHSRGGLSENSDKVQSVNAFGLKLVQRSQFMADQRIPISVKRNLRHQAGEWVLFLPKHERTCIFVGDNPTTLCALGAAYMQQITTGA